MTTEIGRLPAEHVILAPRLAGRWWIVPLLAAGIFMLLAVLTLVAVAVRMRHSHYAAVDKLKSEVARLEAAGEPVTTQALYAFHTVPEGTRDITRIWLDVLRTFDERQFTANAAGLPVVGEGDKAKLLPDAEGSQLAAAEAFLQKYDATLQATLAAAREEGDCRFPMQFEKGIGMLLPHVQKMRNVSQLLSLNVRAHAVRGDIDGALESLDAMYAAANTLQRELCLVEHLVHLANLTRAFEETEWLLNQAGLTDNQLARLQARLQAIDMQTGLTTGLLGERAMTYHTFHHLSVIANDQVLPGVGKIPPLAWGATDGQLGRPADCLKSFELLGEVVAASREPFPEARQKAQQMENRLRAIAGSRNPLDKLQYMVTMLLLPAASNAFDATARGLARRDALVAVIAAERYRLKNGGFPAKLSDLVPDFLRAVPADPFDGQSLKLTQRNGELIIYSVGQDGIDNGGQEGPTPPGTPDIVARVRAEKGVVP